MTIFHDFTRHEDVFCRQSVRNIHTQVSRPEYGTFFACVCGTVTMPLILQSIKQRLGYMGRKNWKREKSHLSADKK